MYGHNHFCGDHYGTKHSNNNNNNNNNNKPMWNVKTKVMSVITGATGTIQSHLENT
jgi:hypothetical protein